MKGVDENTSPPLPIFDKNKYQFSNSKEVSVSNANEIISTSNKGNN